MMMRLTTTTLVAMLALVRADDTTKEACDETADYYAKASHYDLLWGDDNLHFGYFPHLDGSTKVRLTQKQAATELTERMLRMAGVTKGTKVLDLGAGKGRACVDIAESTGASCFGLDLTPQNIERAFELKKAHPHLSLDFAVGSFAALPADVLAAGPFDVVVSQVAFCHAHLLLKTIFQQTALVMGPSSVLLVNDYLGSEDVYSEATKKHVFERLHFETLLGPSEWLSTAFAAGLTLKQYHNLDAHIQTAYQDMARDAAMHGNTNISTAYAATAQAAENRQIGMNLALFTL